LFYNSNTITQSCYDLLEEIGVMDFHGVGSLVESIPVPKDEQKN